VRRRDSPDRRLAAEHVFGQSGGRARAAWDVTMYARVHCKRPQGRCGRHAAREFRASLSQWKSPVSSPVDNDLADALRRAEAAESEARSGRGVISYVSAELARGRTAGGFSSYGARLYAEGVEDRRRREQQARPTLVSPRGRKQGRPNQG
jgi:hypothetical protein